ncbi:RNase HII [Motilibacter rhizosphaerae]|uniref:Ribonuclease HII n=1 Tax=Motilibacter rhizosphaerae TaxID=598652 RepID=A0A4Q7NP86_9ACTN|nr:ribonuclease HII [Motilibacter rhizosphaerae]RZS86983.1 RNase HII [Motilibacter rhizosphaerae]
MPATTPTLRYERQLWRSGAGPVAAVDEVGRGALAGPVSVGVVVLDEDARTAPQGLRDSKLLTPEARTALVPRVRRWVLDGAVGHASAAEIDAWGILTALRVAATRACAQLRVPFSWVLLDGNYDYLSRPSLFEDELPAWSWDVPVRTLVKADMRCSSVAAASVLAKTERDGMMVELAREHPVYAWEQNRGYSAPAHLAALAEHGPSPLHRQSWRLPGVGERADALLPGTDPYPDELEQLDLEALPRQHVRGGGGTMEAHPDPVPAAAGPHGRGTREQERV